MIKHRLNAIQRLIGNTPAFQLDDPDLQVSLKLEGCNFSGSIKDRPAIHILKQGILNGSITQDTVIIESSSGNFAIALATICKVLGTEFIPVIDPYINPVSEKLLRSLCKRVVKVQHKDESGGYLINRINKVQSLLSEIPNSYWTNQYENPLNAEAHYLGTGEEICRDFDHIDYLFASVSSCGTIAGVSKRVKEKFPNATIVAVDAEGSKIFSDASRPRPIPGLGAGLQPKFSKEAIIDEVVMVNEFEIIDACQELLNKYGLFLGGSSGACYAAIDKYFGTRGKNNEVVVTICPDRGNAYLDNIFDSTWVESLKEKVHEPMEVLTQPI